MNLAKRESKLGSKNPQWKGDKASGSAGHARAKSLYPVIGPCLKCGGKGERHHRDGNTLNNDPSNIDILCRRCHMREDGRLARLAEQTEARRLGIIKAHAAVRAKTHCKRGHPLSGDNLRMYRGVRICKTCQRDKTRKRRQNGAK